MVSGVPIFDQHTEMQRAAGLVNPHVYHSADSNKSEIVVVFDTEDTKKAKEFAASADLKEAEGPPFALRKASGRCGSRIESGAGSSRLAIPCCSLPSFTEITSLLGGSSLSP